MHTERFWGRNYLEIYADCGSRGFGVELVIAVSYEYCEVVRKLDALRDLVTYVLISLLLKVRS